MLMVRKLKRQLEVKIILDSREQDETLLTSIKLDKKYGSDKIKICEIEKKCFKALGCKTSTGDLGIEVRFEGEVKWRKTKLSIELKRRSDIVNTLYSSFKRFKNELARADENNLDFWILHDFGFNEVQEHIKKLQVMRKMSYKTQPYYTYLENYLNVARQYGLVCCSDNFESTIRRIIKKHIVENKLQYDYEL